MLFSDRLTALARVSDQIEIVSSLSECIMQQARSGKLVWLRLQYGTQ